MGVHPRNPRFAATKEEFRCPARNSDANGAACFENGPLSPPGPRPAAEGRSRGSGYPPRNISIGVPLTAR